MQVFSLRLSKPCPYFCFNLYKVKYTIKAILYAAIVLAAVMAVAFSKE